MKPYETSKLTLQLERRTSEWRPDGMLSNHNTLNGSSITTILTQNMRHFSQIILSTYLNNFLDSAKITSFTSLQCYRRQILSERNYIKWRCTFCEIRPVALLDIWTDLRAAVNHKKFL